MILTQKEGKIVIRGGWREGVEGYWGVEITILNQVVREVKFE